MTSGNDTTSVQPEQAAPEAVRWAVNVHRIARQRQDKIQADIAAMDAKLAELSKYAAEIATNRAAAGEELEKVTLDADVAMEMAMSACRTHGWTLPEPQGEPPLNETGKFPTVPPPDATQVIPEVATCKNCGNPIARPLQGDWCHTETNYHDCGLPDPNLRAEPADLDQETATPAVTTPDGQADHG